MGWKTPRTDWENYTWFNIADVNRIFGNVVILNDLSQKVRYQFTTLDLVKDKEYTEMPKIAEYNNVEEAIQELNSFAYNLSIGSKKTYLVNGKTFDYTDLNRIESATLELKKWLDNELAHEQKLQFTLGGAKRF